MSITVQSFSENEMNRVASGEESLLSTIFLNKKTFSGKEMIVRNKMRHVNTYIVSFTNGDNTKVFAQSDSLAMEFIGKEYNMEYVEEVSQVVTQYFSIYQNGD